MNYISTLSCTVPNEKVIAMGHVYSIEIDKTIEQSLSQIIGKQLIDMYQSFYRESWNPQGKNLSSSWQCVRNSLGPSVWENQPYYIDKQKRHRVGHVSARPVLCFKYSLDTALEISEMCMWFWQNRFLTFCLLVLSANSLDPYQARHFWMSDLIWIQTLIVLLKNFLKVLILKKNHRTKNMQNCPAWYLSIEPDEKGLLTFLLLRYNLCCWYSLEASQSDISNEHLNKC